MSNVTATGELRAGEGESVRRKVLFVVTEDWYFHSHRLAHAEAAIRAGYDVSVATRESEHGDVIRACGIGLIPFEMTRRGFNPFRECLTILRLAKLYRSHRPDLVHHVALKPVVYGSIAALVARVPATVNAIAGLGYAFTSSDGLARLLKPMIAMLLPRLLNRRGRRVIVQNPDDGDVLREMGVETHRVVLIPGAGVDPRTFVVAEEAPAPVTILLASRMIWDKGIAAFVDAAGVLGPRFSGVRFVLVGRPDPGNPKAVPEAKLNEWNRSGVIEWWGYRADMPHVLAQSHVVCFPSTYGEGIPKILIEAAASGKPIVATDIPGCREVVRNAETGYLVPPGNLDALVNALADLISDPEKRVAMGGRGRVLFEQFFALDQVIAATLALYRGALQE